MAPRPPRTQAAAAAVAAAARAPNQRPEAAGSGRGGLGSPRRERESGGWKIAVEAAATEISGWRRCGAGTGRGASSGAAAPRTVVAMAAAEAEGVERRGRGGGGGGGAVAEEARSRRRGRARRRGGGVEQPVDPSRRDGVVGSFESGCGVEPAPVAVSGFFSCSFSGVRALGDEVKYLNVMGHAPTHQTRPP
jgi:hypothetical protein